MSDTPSREEFVDQLLRQVLADLDDILSEDGDGTAAMFACVQHGAPRAATLVLLAQAAIAAHRSLTGGADLDSLPGDRQAAIDSLQCLIAEPLPVPSLQRGVEAVLDFMAAAEPGSQTPDVNLARAIVRLYAGLGQGDESLGALGLHELRALTVHVDAVASVLRTTGRAETPVPVVRPDRFHDAFMQVSDAIRGGDAVGETPVASLSPDGRISARLVDANHPLAAALAQACAHLGADEATRDAGSRRLVALLMIVDAVRQQQIPEFAGILDDLHRFVGLITAAATAPLLAEGFDTEALFRISAYNAKLMRQPQVPASSVQ